MFRSFFLYLSKANWAKHIIMNWKFAWNMANRFIAGEKLEDAINAIKVLNQKGINATLDHLGENTTTSEEARNATQEIIDIIQTINKSGVRSNISIKLSQIGLTLNKDLCKENLEKILTFAHDTGNFVRIDMEDSPWTDATIDIFRDMVQRCNFQCVGLVVQSYLYRTYDDVAKLLKDCTHLRLCKGAYKEPPDVAFPLKSDVDANYDKIVKLMLDTSLSAGCQQISEDGRIPPLPSIATHDIKRIEFAKNYANSIGLPKKAMEFQMLHGIRRDLQNQLVAEGYPVRIYVPYGTQWYPYFMRRLAERPSNVWFFISNFFRK